MTLSLHRETLATPIGEVVVLTEADGGVRALDFREFDGRMRRLLDRHYGAGGWAIVDRGGPPGPAHAALAAYFSGEIGALDRLPVRTGGTAFQRQVWAALRTIGPGAPVSYAELAHRVGRPAAVRAVGAANGANPVALAAPCHRVVGAGGALTGYAGGLGRKRWLLEHEARHAAPDAHPASFAASRWRVECRSASAPMSAP